MARIVQKSSIYAKKLICLRHRARRYLGRALHATRVYWFCILAFCNLYLRICFILWCFAICTCVQILNILYYLFMKSLFLLSPCTQSWCIYVFLKGFQRKCAHVDEHLEFTQIKCFLLHEYARRSLALHARASRIFKIPRTKKVFQKSHATRHRGDSCHLPG